jgi:hypothetical protein
MLNLDSIDSREDFKASLVTKAMKDCMYLRTLLKDPEEILRKELGSDLANGLTLKSHQETAKSLSFVITYNPKDPESLQGMKVDPSEGLESVLVKKSWKDPAYRAELLTDPRAKLQQEFGLEMLPQVSFNIYEENRSTLQLVVPRDALVQDSNAANRELADAELDAVVGGDMLGSAWGWIVDKIGSAPSPSTGLSDCGSCASGVRG